MSGSKLKEQFKEYLQEKHKDKHSTRELNNRASDILEEDVINFIFDKLEELGA